MSLRRRSAPTSYKESESSDESDEFVSVKSESSEFEADASSSDSVSDAQASESEFEASEEDTESDASESPPPDSDEDVKPRRSKLSAVRKARPPVLEDPKVPPLVVPKKRAHSDSETDSDVPLASRLSEAARAKSSLTRVRMFSDAVSTRDGAAVCRAPRARGRMG